MTPQLLKLIAENKSLKDKIDQYRQTTGLLPYIDDSVIKGGYHVVKNIVERDSIDCCHRKLGMKVLVVGSDLSFKEYILKTDNCKKNIWEEVDVTIEENEVFLIEDYSELSENLTTQKELNLILKQLILNLQTQIDDIELIDKKVQITENTPFAQIGESQKDFNKNIADKVISLTDFIEVTKTELDVLISENKLEPNRLYKITEVESWCFSQHLIKAIYLKAITNNTLEIEGVGEFYTPKYNTSDSNLGIWKGELLANGMISSASYNIGDKVIWGNLFWENISGNIGSNLRAFDDFDDVYLMQNWISETDWQLITPNDDESLYNIQFDSIKYDIENDYINYREDNLGNVYELPYNVLLELNIVNIDPTFIYYLNGIALFQWSNDYFQNNKISDSLVINCNYKHVFKGNFIIEKSIINDNNFFNVDFIGNTFKNSQVIANYLKTYGGILYNNLENSSINLNKYYFEISYNNLKYNSRIFNNNDNNIIVGVKYSRIKGNYLYNFGNLSNNIFVEEGKSVTNYVKGIYDNNVKGFSTISGNTIKNGSRISDNELNNVDEINGNILDTDSNIYRNFLKSACKINGHILTGHGRIYGNTLYRQGEITNCKLRISPASSFASGIHSNEIWSGKIENIDFGNIVNPVGTNPNDPSFGGSSLDNCIIKNKSIIKDLILPDSGGVGLQFIKMNGASEFKNIIVNDSIRSVEFINTVFDETSDYSKIIQGADYGGRGFTKYYLDNVLLQDRFDEKQDILNYTPENVANKSNSYTASSSTTYASSKALVDGLSTKLDKGTYTGTASDLLPYNGALQDVNIASNYFKTSKGFDFTKDVNNYFKTYSNGNYNNFEFYSKDNSEDNFGIILSIINPEEGFQIQKINGNGIINTFYIVETGTYSTKPFISNGGFIKSGGTATQALTADGGTFNLNTKADLVDGKVPSSQLPSYVDDVLEFANLASFPTTGESGKIYIALDTNITYRWTGTGYAEISASLALGETASTAYRGDRGKIAYDHSQVTHDKTLVGLGNVDNTSDLNKPISTATQTALNLKLSTEAPSTTGTVISFSTDKVYGTLTTPETGNITADVTNAKLGVTNIIIHNSATAPTFGSEFKKLSGSGNYVTGVVNYIYCTYISTTEIIYSINQRT